MSFADLTIVTSCVNYGKYLPEWTSSILKQTMFPGRVIIFTHGTIRDGLRGHDAMTLLHSVGISTRHVHHPNALDFGVARNHAVALAETEWVLHLDADDLLLPYAIADFAAMADSCDVIQSGYERIGRTQGLSTRRRLYTGADGLDALSLPAICSGNSPFRKRLWEATPYRQDLSGAWDTALWIGFARLGARFRPTAHPVFQYRQHADSLFSQRRTYIGWSRVHTDAMLKKLRRGDEGVAIIVPRDIGHSPERERNWARVKRHYETHHPSWSIIEGFCKTQVWVKGAAIQDAIDRCDAEVVVIADADVMVPPEALVQSVVLVASGFPWSMPHRLVHRANASVTEALCRSTEFQVPHASSLDRAPYDGVPGGGIVVLRHVMYDAIGGIPYGFRGWGQEDRALAVLCNTLIGPCERGDADLVHLWHPPQSVLSNQAANIQLLRTLGHAAEQGKDSLVATVRAMPRPSAGPLHRVQPIDHERILSRMALRRRR